MYVETLQSLVSAVPMIDNPIDGVVPDFSVFGAEFNSWWKKLFGAIWALAIIWVLAQLVIAIATMAQSKGSHPQELQESRRSAAWAGGALACLAAFGVIVGAILAVAS